MMKVDAKVFAACGALALMTGCASKHIDLGDDTAPVGLGASLSDYQGDWEGYVEAHSWNDGTDRIRLSLDGNGHGVLEVGDSDPLPAPEADLAYPPNGGLVSSAAAVDYSLIAGFSYPLIDPVVQSGRIRLKTQRAALFEEWCELMTPVLDEPNSTVQMVDQYSCLPNVGVRSDGTSCYLGPDESFTTPIDCGLFACMTACVCTESSCEAETAEPDLVLDAALDEDGEVLEGTLLEHGERITVRMTLTH